MSRFWLVFLCCLPALLRADLSVKASRAQELLSGIDHVVEKALADFNVPGIAIGIIYDGEVIYSKGFGYRDFEKKLPVTKETIFPIGSCTKPFTSFLAGTLIDEGLLHWDQPVIELLPEFRMADSYATHNLTIRDVLTHRSGMPRHDFMWYTSNTSRSEILRRIRYLEPSYDLRERYQYNNLMYVTAACAMEAVTSKTWEELISSHILQPLGMKNTHFTIEEMVNSDNYASGYIERKGNLKKVPPRNLSPVAPAGGLNSNVVDLCNWVKMNLNDGAFKGQKLISPATLQEIFSPQIIIPGNPQTSVSLLVSYSIGWNVGSYRGMYYLGHDGVGDGITSLVGFMPKEQIGFVILVNKNLCNLNRYLSFEIVDRILEVPHEDWMIEGLQVYQKTKSNAKEGGEKPQKKGTRPSHPLEDYVGEYEHPGYGKINIQLENGRLRALFNGISCYLDHWHYDIFSIAEESQDLIVSIEGMKFTFKNNLNGDIDELAIPFEPSIDDIVFKKKPSEAAPESFKKYVGFYEIYGYTVEIALRGSSLVAIIPGQPIYELVPSFGENDFSVKMMTGYDVRFEVGEDDKVSEVLIVAPYGAFTATPKED